MLRAFEHQVLEQVRQARAARPLVLRSDVVPDAHRDERHAVIFVDDDVETVGERGLGERNAHVESGIGAGQRARTLGSTHRRQRNRAPRERRDRHLLRDALGGRHQRARRRRVRLAHDDRHAGVAAARAPARRAECGRGTAPTAPPPALRRRPCRRYRSRARSPGTRSGSCSRSRPIVGMLSLRYICTARRVSASDTVCGVVTSTAPATGTVWLRLSAMSPVPGRHVDDQVVDVVPARRRGRTAESRRAASARARSPARRRRVRNPIETTCRP